MNRLDIPLLIGSSQALIVKTKSFTPSPLCRAVCGVHFFSSYLLSLVFSFSAWLGKRAIFLQYSFLIRFGKMEGESAASSGCSCGQGGGRGGGSGVEMQATAAITLHIHPTTGGHFEVQVPHSATVDALKKVVSKRLKVPKDRICLLLKERHLREGSLQQNSVKDGCKITLLPSVETGLLAQRPEQNVMQALESLSDAQVSDFLSGKAPLNLTMRLGDHMMFIQLQLSTVAPTPPRRLNSHISSKSSMVAADEITSCNPFPVDDPCRSSSAFSSSPSSSRAAESVKPVLDAKALAEASRNLTHTLRQLSSAALSTRVDETEDVHLVRRRQGAIIESMHHHGRGVYSGTFSGTLNPALQDKHGRPKRDISTIIHILNDLLGATPQYRRHRVAAAVSAASTDGVQTKLSLTDKSQDEFNQLTLENRATRGKMERLQMMLEQRRARRRARRENRAPYTWSSNSKSMSSSVDSGREAATRGGDTDSNSSSDFHPIAATETVVV